MLCAKTSNSSQHANKKLVVPKPGGPNPLRWSSYFPTTNSFYLQKVRVDFWPLQLSGISWRRRRVLEVKLSLEDSLPSNVKTSKNVEGGPLCTLLVAELVHYYIMRNNSSCLVFMFISYYAILTLTIAQNARSSQVKRDKRSLTKTFKNFSKNLYS